MRIVLNVLADGSCAQVYAYADPGEELWRAVPSIKIWHNDTTESIVLEHNSLRNCDNDSYLSFTSEVSFASFCEAFASSEYNDPKNYRKLWHNCANAAYFALQLAKINLPALSCVKFMSLSPNTMFKIPGPTLTPVDLYRIARQRKLELLHCSAKRFSRLDFKLDLAKSTLRFRAREETSEKRQQCVETIVSEIDSSVKKRPHHSDHYLQTHLLT